MKHSDSLFRCKSLKVAALGYFATIMKKQSKGLKFLEEVSQRRCFATRISYDFLSRI